MKPIFKTFIIISVLALVGLTAYFVLKNGGGADGVPESGAGGKQTETATPGESALKKISEQPVFGFWINPGTGEVFYFTSDGRVFGAKDGPDLEISKQTVNALNSIEVGPKSERVLAAFGDPQEPQWGIFDVVDGAWRPLPADILEAAWGGDSEKLVAVVKSGNSLNLAEADVSQTPPSYRVLVRDFRLKDVKLTYVPENRVIISELPSSSYAGSVWQLDLKTLTLNLLVAPEEGLDISWSDNKELAFFFSPGSGFSILNGNLQTIMPRLFDTLPQKCAADSSKIYCFVPQNIPADTVLPDDYLTKEFFSIDDLFVSGTGYEEVTRALSSNAAGVPAIDAKNPQVLGDKLYFVNRYDDGLYEVSL